MGGITAENNVVGTLPNGTSVVAASLAEGRVLLTAADDFVCNQSRFDRQARTRLRHSACRVTQAIYLDFVSSAVMEWEPDEIEALTSILQSIRGKFVRLHLKFPDTVYLVKTSGVEEGYAAYTRKENVIVLPANMVASLRTAVSFDDPLHPGDDTTYLEDVIIHEFFHIFSKNNPDQRYQLYSLVNYHPTGNDVELPDSLADRKITNPDTPNLNVYIEMETAKGRKPLLPVLLASGPYAGGIFFEYLQWVFLAIQKDAAGLWVPVIQADGKPESYASKDLLAQYMRLVGDNFTQETFHPDEILAQSFVLVVNQPSMGLLDRIGSMLS